MDQKFDAPLRQKMTTLDNEQRSEILAVFGKCSSVIDESMRRHIANIVVEVQSVTADLFVVRVSSEDVFELARLKFISQLHLSQESQPLPN